MYSRLLKRLFDLTVVLIGGLLCLPLIVLLCFLVRVQLGSPIFFRQTRPGKDGRPFQMIKFRTMTEERGADGELLPDSERLTRLGRFLRSSSLDELPEL